MKTKILNSIMAFFTLCFLCTVYPLQVYASEGEEYITISVDAVDDNGNLKYALDTDDPSAFTDSNEFTVPAGTSHTIYVKDVAGNITSQTYSPEKEEDMSTYPTADDEQKINIDLELGQSNDVPEEDFSDYEYLADDPVEPGTGTVAEKIKTDGSDNAEKVFYTFTTKEGEVLYLVIDQGQSSDNVYLLDTVSASDLQVLAVDGNSSKQEEEDNLLSALALEEEPLETEETDNEPSAASTSGKNAIIILALAAVGGVAYYYLKVYKNKKDETMDALDAMDMDEFEPEEEEEIDFDIDDAEKEKYLEALINEDENTDDESLFDMDPDEYATSHIEEDAYDADIDYPEDDENYEEEYENEEEEV